MIRTQELLAATRGYGVKLYFTRARDFGFSKTPEETEKVWGDQVLEDMVRVIRTFRPNIVISNFGNVHSGHGHHQASGLLTPKAVKSAADPNAYPELQKEGLKPWSAGTAGVQIMDLDRGSDSPQGYSIPVGEVSPLYGKTYREIGLDAFANHRTQGISAFLGSPFLRRPIGLIPEAGSKFAPGMLNANLIALSGDDAGLGCGGKASYCDTLKKVDDDLAGARAAALELNWKQSSPSLPAREAISNRSSRLVKAQRRRGRFSRRTGRWLRSISIEPSRLPRASNKRRKRIARMWWLVKLSKSGRRRRCRPKSRARSRSRRWCCGLPDQTQSGHADANSGDADFTVTLNREAIAARGFRWQICRSRAPLVEAKQTVTVAGYRFDAKQPGDAHRSDFDACRSRAAANGSGVHADGRTQAGRRGAGEKATPFDVLLRVHSYATQAHKVSVGLDVPQGWTASQRGGSSV